MSAYHFDAGMLPDLPDAACRGVDADLFFADGRALAAKRVCGGCTMRQPCLAYAVQARVQGVWGGTDEAERRRLVGRPNSGVLAVPADLRVGPERSRGSAAPRRATPQAPLTGPGKPAPSLGGKHTLPSHPQPAPQLDLDSTQDREAS